MTNSWDYQEGDLLHIHYHGLRKVTGTIIREYKYQCTSYPFEYHDKWDFLTSEGQTYTLIQDSLDNTKTIKVLARNK